MSSKSGPEPPDETGTIETRPIYKGRIVRLSVDTVRLPDGSTGEMEVVRHSGAAAVLPLLDEPGVPDLRIRLLRQYRYPSGGYLLEVPAGRPSHPDEEWTSCAQRELEEEAGLIAERLVPLTTIYTTPGFTDEKIHLFLAIGVQPGTRNPDAKEFIEPVTLTLREALEWIEDGRIVDAKTICTLFCAASYLSSVLS